MYFKTIISYLKTAILNTAILKIAILKIAIVGPLALTLISCQSPHTKMNLAETVADFAENFSNQTFSEPPLPEGDRALKPKDWYIGFDDPVLTKLIATSLKANLDIQQAWSSLRQSGLNTRITGAKGLPDISLSADLGQNKSNGDSQRGWRDSNSVSAVLNWEIDLWQRIKHTKKASKSEFQATRAELSATYLLISTQTSRVYFNILRQLAIIQLVKQQIETNQQFLNLTQIRKSTGQGSILDLQQQQQRLLTTQIQLPEAEKNLRKEYRNLAILLGKSPLNFQPTFIENFSLDTIGLPQPPTLTHLPEPKALMLHSPLLYAAFLRLEALNHRVAASAANRLPKLSLFASHSRQDSGLVQPSTLRLSNVAINLTQPIFNAQALKNTHLANQEALQEAILAFEESYLSTLADIENAIEGENYQKLLLANTLERLDLAKKSVSEAKFQYANGLTDYLNVLLSLETLQQLELQALNVHRNLLDSHINITLATGGPTQLPKLQPQLSK